MIITRTADIVEFQLSEARRVKVDVAQVASAAMSISRGADGRLAPALELKLGAHQLCQRIEAGLEHLGIMYARIVELMQEVRGPVLAVASPGSAGHGLDLPY